MRSTTLQAAAMQCILLMLLMSFICTNVVSALPRGPREHFQLSAATTPADTYFDPQPQYIKLARPTTQSEVQKQIEIEVSSQLKEKDVPSAGALGTWGGVQKETTKSELLHILEDWKAWKAQFDQQASERSCRFSKRGCARWNKRK
ncbi:hypothetical protein PV11_06586 [Exophiala sideris]|uniref:Uncharacterized protein n=1 Tax=Exophiala sideris TaxID=1016849 RepID=A0A0D1Y818_9EURO|nr:hypothetical protein PV11_06586 [Exophiala sideris]